MGGTEVELLGFTAVAFERGGRTYVVVARRPQAELVEVIQSFERRVH
jgi:hypothetical protein